MKYYPVNLDINNRNCLVVGGGAVATRKIKTLLDCGAKILVISLDFSKELQELSDLGVVKLEKRKYRKQDLENVFLVMGATDNMELNRMIHSHANELNILCNIADYPEACNFILPSIVNRGDLIISVSTSGKSPAYAKKIRKTLEKSYGTEHEIFLKLMGGIRTKLLNEEHEPEAHKTIFEQLIEADLVQLIKNRNTEKINKILYEILGGNFEFESLIKNTESVNPDTGV